MFSESMSIILASKSPRRQKLLDRMRVNFKTMTSDADETLPDDCTAEEAVRLLALRKARAVQERCDDEDIIIGADTVVALDGEILGKPDGESEAFAMLTMLAGGWHDVYTGLAVLCGDREETAVERTRVKFAPLDSAEIEAYLATDEPFDKAGAYGIQGVGGALIERIEGDYYNVVGLPLCRLRRMLKESFDVDLLVG